MVTKNNEVLQKNPFARENFEYDMDTDTWFNDTQTFTDDQLTKMQNEYEAKRELAEKENQRKAEEEKTKTVEIQEVKEELLVEDNQEKLKESVSEDIIEVNAKKENILPAPGEDVAPPKYIGWDKVFTVKQKDDSEKMADIRVALAKYHDVKGEPAEADALRRVIQYCNNYTWMKVPFLKFGKAKKRLNEVKRLREEAKAALEQSPYIVNYSFVEHEYDNDTQKTKTKTDKEGPDQLIHYETGTYTDNAGVSTAGKVAANVAGVLSWMVLFPLELATYPLRAMAYGVDKLYRKVEKSYGVIDERREINMGIHYRPGQYYSRIIIATHSPLFTKSGKKKEEIIKKRGEMDDAMYTTSERLRFLEQGQDEAIELKNYKRELIKEYKKKKPNEDKINTLESKVESSEELVNSFCEQLKEDYPEDAAEFDFKALETVDDEYKKAKKEYDESGKRKAPKIVEDDEVYE